MLIDLHLLQNYAPSNLNRDDTGAPKDAVFGNVVRARISSQALKRAIRRSEVFRDAFAEAGLLAQRTQRLPSLLRPRLTDLGLDREAVEVIVRRSQEIGRESGKKAKKSTEDGDPETREVGGEGGKPQRKKSTEDGDPETKQLIFLADHEIDELARKLAALYQRLGRRGFEKLKTDEMTRQLGASVPRSVDIAMFGRMTTSAVFEDVTAAVQVAHPLSTHAVESEFDYYTAVDDISGEAGAGFIGDTPFNSATYYKYLSVHWEGLVDNLGGDREVAAAAVGALIWAAATVNPTGKQNSFAAHNLPDLVLVEVRERNVPMSYANAFLKPVWTRGHISLMDASVERLAEYMTRLNAVYNIEAKRAWVGTGDWELPDAKRQTKLGELIDWLPLSDGPAA